MTGNAAALLVVISILIGIVGTVFALWLRDTLREAERWGTSLDLDAAVQDVQTWTAEAPDAEFLAVVARGLEDVKLRVKPLHDWKRTGEL